MEGLENNSRGGVDCAGHFCLALCEWSGRRVQMLSCGQDGTCSAGLGSLGFTRYLVSATSGFFLLFKANNDICVCVCIL